MDLKRVLVPFTVIDGKYCYHVDIGKCPHFSCEVDDYYDINCDLGLSIYIERGEDGSVLKSQRCRCLKETSGHPLKYRV